MRKVFDKSGSYSAAETEEAFPPLPCSICRKAIKRETLTNYGARCFQCFEDYCRKQTDAPAWMADKRSEGPKAWAKALLLHHAGGLPVPKVVLTMAKAALHRELSATSAMPAEDF